jgi:hypothetical protein
MQLIQSKLNMGYIYSAAIDFLLFHLALMSFECNSSLSTLALFCLCFSLPSIQLLQVEMVHSKRLNVQKFSIEGNPRKVLHHNESKTLFMIRTGLISPSCSSDICQVDPLSGSVLSKFKCEEGETAKCMQIVNVGYEQMLVVGTSRSPGPLIMPSGEAERFVFLL